ncbi:MAG: DoxX family membrane protein [Euzebya sp.]
MGLGVPAPVAAGYAVTFVELIGGALLIVGLLSRLSAVLIALALGVVFASSGRASLDHGLGLEPRA